MTSRTYGVKSASGVQVTEDEVRGPIEASDFGATAMIGVVDRGPVGEPIAITGPKQVRPRIGSRIDNSEVRYAADDFWRHSGGAGRVYAVRVTDGAEVAATTVLYGRMTAAGSTLDQGDRPDHGIAPTPILRVTAANGGRWAGRRRDHAVRDVTIAGNVTATTIDTGEAMVEDLYKGADLLLIGAHDTAGSRRYRVTGNDTDGVITVESGNDLAADVAEGTAQSEVTVMITLGDALTVGTEQGLSVRVREGSDNPLEEFGLDVFLDGQRVRSWDGLSMDPTSSRYVERVVNDDLANNEIVVEDLLPSFTSIGEINRPGNYTGTPIASTTADITFSPFKIVRNDNNSNSIRVVKAKYTDSLVTDGQIAPPRLTMKFVWDADHFVVTAEGEGIDDVSLPDTDTITTPDNQLVYSAGVPWIPDVEFDVTTDVEDDDTCEIFVDPIVTDMATGWVYPDVDENQYLRFSVRETEEDKVILESGDPTDTLATAGVAVLTGTEDGPFTLDDNRLFIGFDGRLFDAVADTVEVVLTGTPTLTATEVVDEINTAITDIMSEAGALADVEIASVVDGKIVLTSPGGFDGGGPASSITVVDSDSDGTPGVLGLAEGTVRGEIGSRSRIEYQQGLTSGYDGLEPTLSDYMDAASTVDSPLNDLDASVGNVMVTLPGIAQKLNQSDLATLYSQVNSYCESRPYVHLAETPDTYGEDAAIQFYQNLVGRSDMMIPYMPTYGYVPDPDAPGTLKKLTSIGKIAGIWAAKAATNLGYYLPGAGVDAVLQGVVALPEAQKGLDHEVLTPVGINPLKRLNAGWAVWGARTMHTSSVWRQASNRMQMNHYVWVFLDAYDWVIFRLNDRITWGQIKSQAREYLAQEWANRVLFGASEDEAFSIKIDSDNNPQSEIDLGNSHLDIELNLTKFIERLKISIGAGGVTEA